MGEGTGAGARIKRGIARPATPRIRSAVAIAALWALAVPGATQAFTEGADNNFFGTGAGASNTGTANSFFGGSAGAANTTGEANSFFGRDAGQSNTTGFSNSFFGRGAGFLNTDGHDNSFFGRDAGVSNTTGDFNSFFGHEAGRSNTTGADNSFFGRDAGDSNTTGFSNSFFGRDAGASNTDGGSNSFFGRAAGEDNTASANSFFGSSAGTNNTTGANNSVFGGSAGFSNTTGFNNSFFGHNAGHFNTDGGSNSFFGRQAGLNNTTGGENSFFGRSAGFFNTTGFDNSFFGRSAGFSNTTGGSNTFVGISAGDSNTTGLQNTALGRFADVTGGVSDATALGHHALVGQANSLVLGAIDGVNGAGADTSVGIGTTTPDAPLHVESDNPTGASGNELLRLEQANAGPVQDRALMLLRNNGGTRFQFDNTATSNSWRFQAGTGNQDNFELAKVGTGEIEMTLGPSGDLEIAGTLSQNSDRKAKEAIEPVKGKTVLRELAGLAISEWTYKRDRTDARHLGPMAQDFHSAFGLGSDRTNVAPGDMAGVALAGLKAQQRQIERLERQVRRLRAG